MLGKTLNVQTQGIKIIKVIFTKSEWENVNVLILNESIRKTSVCLYRYAPLIMQNNTIQIKIGLGLCVCLCMHLVITFFSFYTSLFSKYSIATTYTISFLKNYCSMVALQGCISCCCTAKQISYMCTFMPLFLRFPSHLDHHRALGRIPWALQ